MGSLGQLAQTIGQLLGQLMKPSSDSGSGAGSGAGAPGTTGGLPCPNGYSQVSTPTSDPCAYYVAPGSGTTGISTTTTQNLLDALNGSNGSIGTTSNAGNTTIGQINNALGGSGSTPNPSNPNSGTTGLNGNLTPGATVTGTFGPQGSQNTNNVPNDAGLSGGIQTTGTGATFVTNQVQGNTQTSSFFGGNTIAGFVSNLIGGWCQSRPWAGGFIASIIPPAFFDGLCTQNGFAIGPPPVPTNTASGASAQTSVVLTQSPVQQAAHQPSVVQQTIASSTPLIPPRVDIWAVPPTVPLGARTTIFWNTENVTNCTELSPDGSFNQSSLSGGAATVPLTEPTTFTISCLDSQHNPATSYVRVTISS